MWLCGIICNKAGAFNDQFISLPPGEFAVIFSMYDSPPLYSPPYSTTSHSFYPPRSIHSPQSQYVPYTHNLPPDSYYMEERPQHFYRWFSPPGFVKTFQGATVLICFLIFSCVASTLVWDMNGFGYGGYGSIGGVAGTGSGYYGGSYGYGNSYMTPHSAKSAMISMAAINFLVSLGFLTGSFSRSRMTRGCRFYLIVFICDIILAVLQVSALTKNKKWLQQASQPSIITIRLKSCFQLLNGLILVAKFVCLELGGRLTEQWD